MDNQKPHQSEMSGATDALSRDLAELKQISDAVMAGTWAGPKPRLLSESELISLNALVSFVAHTRSLSEDDVRKNFHDRFSVSAVDQLSPAVYDDAVRFLVDQVPAEAVG